MKIIFLDLLATIMTVSSVVPIKHQPIADTRHVIFNKNQRFGDDLYYQNQDAIMSTSKEREQDNLDLRWFKTNIVDKHGFQKTDNKDEWKKAEMPVFTSDTLADPTFAADAERIQEFFKRNSNWEITRNNLKYRRTEDDCIELLYVTAARYVLVSHILWLTSDKQLMPCTTKGWLYEIPSSVCYPAPYGSTRCTSDYDVALIGKDSGTVTNQFNKHIQDVFGKPSQTVFDTNVYAFTLEYAMPLIFSGLPNEFVYQVLQEENSTRYKMQELASSYYKVFKYNEEFAKQLVETTTSNLKETSDFNMWMNEFELLNNETGFKDIEDLRTVHNSKYEGLVQAMSDLGGHNHTKRNLDNLARALFYAAQAYHTRGAIRHVVGGRQMGIRQYKANNLRNNDLLVSMIENWGEANKEYNNCRNKILEECLKKMSKYLWRMLDAMNVIRNRLTFNDHVLTFSLSTHDDKYKKTDEIPFRILECSNERPGVPLSYQCMKNINNKVDIYNKMIINEIFQNKGG